TVDQVDDEFTVVNPIHSKIEQQIKKTREKIARRNANLYVLKEKSANTDIDQTPKQANKQRKIQNQLDELNEQLNGLIQQRKTTPHKIKVKDMGENRYNKLHTESKL
ncbi:hypothetical protein, partial [Limnospira sp. PMC 1249.20]|uniref:hypothetical protein n=2 Tax=unclassified Limnospira TaxID=2642885 RepID=UPI0028E0C40B